MVQLAARRRDGRWVLALGAAILVSTSAARADPPPATRSLTLEGAIRFALEHSPALQTSRASTTLANAQVDLARSSLLPSAGVSAEVNRATGNVVPGSLFALEGIPTVAGPPMVPPHFDGGAWGSALGIWGNWNVSDLLRRMRLVDAALAGARQARAAMDARRLEVAYATVDAFVNVVAARESARAFQAESDRARVLVTTVQALAQQQLRPEADLARAQAELAQALTQLAQAEQLDAEGRARLAEVLGIAGEPIDVVAGDLAGPLDAAARAPQLDRHPLRLAAEQAIQQAEREREAVGLEYLPRFDLVASLWLRGSGYYTAETNLGAAQGLLPDTPNWGIGIVASWPVLDMITTRARMRVADAQLAVERSRRDEIVQALAGQLDAARAALEGANRVAAQSAPALVAAQAAERQATARYRAGLGTLVEVAEAQELLARADLGDVVARLGVWRARLLVARALGDLTPFVRATQPSGAR